MCPTTSKSNSAFTAPLGLSQITSNSTIITTGNQISSRRQEPSELFSPGRPPSLPERTPRGQATLERSMTTGTCCVPLVTERIPSFSSRYPSVRQRMPSFEQQVYCSSYGAQAYQQQQGFQSFHHSSVPHYTPISSISDSSSSTNLSELTTPTFSQPIQFPPVGIASEKMHIPLAPVAESAQDPFRFQGEIGTTTTKENLTSACTRYFLLMSF